MTRQIEQLNHEMGRINLPADSSLAQRDIGFIVSLFKYKNVHLKAIGDQFIQHFRQKDPTALCLCLLALYEELNIITYVTQRLLICYLIYRLKDLWKPETVEKAGMFSHPHLIIFVKIYWTYISPPRTNIKDRSLLHLLGEFPKITAQEAYFVGRILTGSPHILKDLYELSPNLIANNPTGLNQIINIDPLKSFVEHQLRQFPFFEAVLMSTSTSLPPRQSFGMFEDPGMFASLKEIVLSLVSPTAAKASLNNNHLKSRTPTETPPPAPISRRSIINSSYGFFSPPVNSIGTPPGIIGRPAKTQSILTSIFNSSAPQPVKSRDETPTPPIKPKVEEELPKIQKPISTPSRDSTPSLSDQQPTEESTQLPDFKNNDEAVENRVFAFEILKKIVSGSGASLSKSQITKLLCILNVDKEILPMIEISSQEFEVIVESQPDLGAEILFQFHVSNSPELYKSLDVLLNIDLSVQSMVAVSRFISSCDRSSLYIPEEFLNSYITHCIQACDNSNQLPAHRLIRMVCVFFSTLVRLSNFNIKPRINEMQNFATTFSSVKETSQLYQAITQIMK